MIYAVYGPEQSPDLLCRISRRFCVSIRYPLSLLLIMDMQQLRAANNQLTIKDYACSTAFVYV